jgi:hypothetical protein
MMVDHIDGNMTMVQLARKYDCTPNSAKTTLEFARAHGLYLDRARQLIEAELLPRALAVYEKYLDGGRQDGGEAADDLAAARDVLFGIGALSKSTTVKHTPSDVADTLDTWREKYFEETRVTVLPSPTTPALIEPVDEDREQPRENVADLSHSSNDDDDGA